MGDSRAFDPFSAGTVECPFPFYAALRRDAPVYRVPGAGHFVVSRAADIRTAVMHPEVFSSELVAVPTPGGVMRLETLLARFPKLRLARSAENPRHTPSLFVRRLRSLMVELEG